MKLCNETAFQFWVLEEYPDGVHMVIDGTD